MTAHGKNLHFAIADSGAVSRVLSTYLRSVSGLPRSDAPVVDATAAGVNDRVYKRGIKSSSFTIRGLYDSTATTGPDTVLFGIAGAEIASAFIWGPEGSTTGMVKYTGSAWCTKYSQSADYDGMVQFEADFQLEGAITRGTF